MDFEKDIQGLGDASLIELYKKIQEHIQYLKSSILIVEGEDSNE